MFKFDLHPLNNKRIGCCTLFVNLLFFTARIFSPSTACVSEFLSNLLLLYPVSRIYPHSKLFCESFCRGLINLKTFFDHLTCFVFLFSSQSENLLLPPLSFLSKFSVIFIFLDCLTWSICVIRFHGAIKTLFYFGSDKACRFHLGPEATWASGAIQIWRWTERERHRFSARALPHVVMKSLIYLSPPNRIVSYK